MARNLKARLIDYLSDYPEGLSYMHISRGMGLPRNSSMELTESILEGTEEGLIIQDSRYTDSPAYRLTEKGFIAYDQEYS